MGLPRLPETIVMTLVQKDSLNIKVVMELSLGRGLKDMASGVAE